MTETITASDKRRRLIEAINKRLTPPTADEMRALRQHGAESWGEYIADQADNSGVSIGNAYSLFSMLGESEAFDGFVTSLEDMENEGE